MAQPGLQGFTGGIPQPFLTGTTEAPREQWKKSLEHLLEHQLIPSTLTASSQVTLMIPGGAAKERDDRHRKPCNQLQEWPRILPHVLVINKQSENYLSKITC